MAPRKPRGTTPATRSSARIAAKYGVSRSPSRDTSTSRAPSVSPTRAAQPSVQPLDSLVEEVEEREASMRSPTHSPARSASTSGSESNLDIMESVERRVVPFTPAQQLMSNLSAASSERGASPGPFFSSSSSSSSLFSPSSSSSDVSIETEEEVESPFAVEAGPSLWTRLTHREHASFRRQWEMMWWNRTEHGLNYHNRKPITTIICGGLAMLMFALSLCSVGTWCRGLGWFWAVFGFAFQAPLQAASMWLAYFMMTVGVGEAVVGAWNVSTKVWEELCFLSHRAPDGMRPSRRSLSRVLWVIYNDGKDLVLQPLVILYLTISLRDYVPLMNSLGATFLASVLLHIAKWACEGAQLALPHGGDHPFRFRDHIVWTFFTTAFVLCVIKDSGYDLILDGAQDLVKLLHAFLWVVVEGRPREMISYEVISSCWQRGPTRAVVGGSLSLLSNALTTTVNRALAVPTINTAAVCPA